ncbi:MAG TPA: hypothetical protein VGA61_11590 [Anaerolineae bacterium]
MKRSSWILVSLLLVASMLLSACGPAPTPIPTAAPAAPAQPAAPTAPTAAPAAPAAAQATSAPAAAAQPTKAPAAAATNTTVPPTKVAPAGATRIAWWHAMTGDTGGKVIPKLADDFNASQQKCFVDLPSRARMTTRSTSSRPACRARTPRPSSSSTTSAPA